MKPCLFPINIKVPIKNENVDFPGGPVVVKNPPAYAGETGSIPGLGRSHMPRRNWAHAPQLPSPRHLEPELSFKRGHHHEKPSQQLESSPQSAAKRELPRSNQDQHSPK